MKIHEFQAKELMKARGIPVPEGHEVSSVADAISAVAPLVEASGNPVVVVKSQIHAGGRGKGRFKEDPDLGGVNVVTDGIEGGVEAAKKKVGELAGRDVGVNAGHRADRPGRKEGHPAVHRAGHRHREGAVPVRRARPLG